MGFASDQAASVAGGAGIAPLAVRIAAQVSTLSSRDLDDAIVAKVGTCLYDLAGCAFEAGSAAPSLQAKAMAAPADASAGTSATIIGSSQAVSTSDASFVNAVMGHGLVREDMHAASVSHLGVVVIPTVLALAQRRRVGGADFVAAIVAGYETGAKIGRSLVDARIARMLRPTGITGPLGAAAAGARLLGFDTTRTAHALALAANTTAGLNQWGHTGGSEMYFHAGFAARNAVAAVLLADAGAFASPSALDGEAGLFASLGKRAASGHVRLFDGPPEILSVYHKPLPACNFAQTACQAALALARGGSCPVERIASIAIRVPQAGASYPGCDFTGPFEHVLQAKMSIQYNVVAALAGADVTEANFERLDDPDIRRLLSLTRLEPDEAMSRVYPAQQGGEVDVGLVDGTRHVVRLPDVVNATAQDVRVRFRRAASACLGRPAVERLEAMIADLVASDDAGRIAGALGSQARP